MYKIEITFHSPFYFSDVFVIFCEALDTFLLTFVCFEYTIYLYLFTCTYLLVLKFCTELHLFSTIAFNWWGHKSDKKNFYLQSHAP